MTNSISNEIFVSTFDLYFDYACNNYNQNLEDLISNIEEKFPELDCLQIEEVAEEARLCMIDGYIESQGY